ncbi:MAG: type II toxin-antitoxin system VapC family toxin [Candidatus Methanoperedens sp.]|nr:type II toxin-antitoxin system VapC family toxin [Candidatus Methanoperedens sp.]
MNGKDKYLIDTNVLIYFLQGDKPAVSFFKKIINDELYISLINKIEVLSFPDLSDEEEKSINQFLLNFVTLDVDNAVAEETIRIRKKYRLKLGDALICATSIMHDTVLVSRNEQDFSRVKELKFLNPY